MTTITLHNETFGTGPAHVYMGGSPLNGAAITITIKGLTAGNIVSISTGRQGEALREVTLKDSDNNNVVRPSVDGTYTFTAEAGTNAIRAALSGVQGTAVSVTAAF